MHIPWAWRDGLALEAASVAAATVHSGGDGGGGDGGGSDSGGGGGGSGIGGGGDGLAVATATVAERRRWRRQRRHCGSGDSDADGGDGNCGGGDDDGGDGSGGVSLDPSGPDTEDDPANIRVDFSFGKGLSGFRSVSSRRRQSPFALRQHAAATDWRRQPGGFSRPAYAGEAVSPPLRRNAR